MRVGVGRPRQISQGDDKDKNNVSEERARDSAAMSGKEENANDAQESGFVKAGGERQHANTSRIYSFRTVSHRVAGQMVSGTFVPVCGSLHALLDSTYDRSLSLGAKGVSN